MSGASGSYGRLADEIRLDFKIFFILCRLNYLDFYFVDISTMLLIVLEVHFSLCFSNKACFRVCSVVRKLWSPFFTSQSLLLGTIIPNDILSTCCVMEKKLFCKTF